MKDSALVIRCSRATLDTRAGGAWEQLFIQHTAKELDHVPKALLRSLLSHWGRTSDGSWRSAAFARSISTCLHFPSQPQPTPPPMQCLSLKCLPVLLHGPTQRCMISSIPSLWNLAGPGPSRIWSPFFFDNCFFLTGEGSLWGAMGVGRCRTTVWCDVWWLLQYHSKFWCWCWPSGERVGAHSSDNRPPCILGKSIAVLRPHQVHDRVVVLHPIRTQAVFGCGSSRGLDAVVTG